jgi:hypothetical protein
MLQTQLHLATAVTYARAVIVTGTDERGNEYAYWLTDDYQWFDVYNERYIPDRQASLVIGNVDHVRFGSFEMSVEEWRRLGNPLRLDLETLGECAAAQGYAEGQRIRNETASAAMLKVWAWEAEHPVERGGRFTVSGGEVEER